MVLLIGDTSVLSCQLGKPSPNGKRRINICVAPAGVKAGFISAQTLRGLEEFGIGPSRFDVVLGTSSGFHNLAAYCGGQASAAPDVYLHMASRPWVKPGGRRGKWLTFYDYLEDLLLGNIVDGLKLDVDAIARCPTRKIAAVSDLRGKVRYHEVESADDVFPLMRATSAIFPFSLGVSLDGRRVVDGAYTHAHCQFARIVRSILRDAGPDTDVCVLFLANRPGAEHLDWKEAYAYSLGVITTLFWAPWLLASALGVDKKVERSELMFRRPVRHNVRLCAIVPERTESVNPWEWDAAFMVQQGEKLRASLREQLDRLVS